MKKAIISGAAAAFMVLLLSSCGGQAAPAAPAPAPAPAAAATPLPAAGPAVGIQVGNLAPDIKLNDLDGKPVSLSDYRGKAVLLNFWATW